MRSPVYMSYMRFLSLEGWFLEILAEAGKPSPFPLDIPSLAAHFFVARRKLIYLMLCPALLFLFEITPFRCQALFLLPSPFPSV